MALDEISKGKDAGNCMKFADAKVDLKPLAEIKVENKKPNRMTQEELQKKKKADLHAYIEILKKRYDDMAAGKAKAAKGEPAGCTHSHDSNWTASDTITPEIKAQFFTKRETPNLMFEYDVIGLSSSTVKFKDSVNKLIIKSVLAELCEQFPDQYSERLTNFDFEKNMHMCMRNMVWDVDRGLILQLREHGIIDRAFSGFLELTADEIKVAYGETPVYVHLKIPATNRDLTSEFGNHMVLTS